jgi:MOSC domain-containing protein YiiM
MKVISVNIGEKVKVSWRGKSVETGIFKKEVSTPIYLDVTDVLNDAVVDRRYHGGIDKACYLYSAEAYSYWKERYPEVDLSWGAMGENITLSGLDESAIKIGAHYQIGEAIIEVAQPRQPCFKQGIRFGTQKIVKDFINSPYSGIYVRVLQPGYVHKDDEMQLIQQPCGTVSVGDVHSLLGTNKSNKLLAKMAINTPQLAESYRKDLIKRFG